MHNSSLVSLSQSQANLIGLGSHLSVEERNDLFDLLTHAEGFASRFLDHEELWKPWLTAIAIAWRSTVASAGAA